MLETTDPVPPVPALRDRGFVDRIGADRVVGWAWNPEQPDQTVTLDVFDGEDHLLTIEANLPRPDLLQAGVGNGNYGFVIDNIGVLLPRSRHLLHIRDAVTRAELPGSPQWVIRPDAGLDAPATAFIDGVLSSLATHATAPATIDHALALLLTRLSDLINARHRLDPGAEGRALVARATLTGDTARLVADLLATYRPITIEPAATPLVSVIIPVHDHFNLTYDCIASIARARPTCPIEIIIVDDASRDETMVASLIFTGAIRIIRLTANEGFIAAANTGAAAARGEYLFFLNNDTLVHDRWLDALVETFANTPGVGVAGSRLLFADGRLQEAGGIVWRLGDAWNWGRGQDAAAPRFNYLRDADYVSGAALMLPRALFSRLGGFDPIYRPAYYEDTDLCFKIRALGLRVVVQPASTITHLEGASHGTDPAGTGIKRYQAINNRVFFNRWKTILASHRMTGEHPELEAERGVRLRALFIDDVILTPMEDAGSSAALQHILALQHRGYKVTFIPSWDMARSDPATRALESIGVECLYSPFAASVEDVLRQSTIAPDLVYLHRFSNAAKYAALVRDRFPHCRLVFNICDLQFLREEREAALLHDPALHASAALKRERELAAMRLVDCVIVYSTAEAALLREALPATRIALVPWAVTIRPTTIPFADRAGYGFIGGFRHPPNVDAMQHFTSAILPHLPPLPNQRLVIIGSNLPETVARLHSAAIDVRGHVPDLADALHPLRATIAPLRYGAGIKGKVLESFAHGLPCIMSEIAAEGLPLSGDLLWLIARSDDEFRAKLTRILTDEAWNHTLATAGLAMLEQFFSTEAMLEHMQAALA
ncbi:glycosyltransferase [Acidiphilium sp.]|uniref:glycosyltransferase n=1 Tax=Acidiphilium sp. TaxID=527 RepID=UPI003D04E932